VASDFLAKILCPYELRIFPFVRISEHSTAVVKDYLTYLLNSDFRLLGLWVRIPPRAWMSVSCKCCVLSGRGLCDGLVPRPEESY
jgi:hypothetical protein